MKATGIVRRIDDLGRIVIPKEIRRTLNLAEGDPMEIGVDKDQVILQKYNPLDCCLFCGSHNNITTFERKPICEYCLQKIQEIRV